MLAEMRRRRQCGTYCADKGRKIDRFTAKKIECYMDVYTGGPCRKLKDEWGEATNTPIWWPESQGIGGGVQEGWKDGPFLGLG